MENGENAGFQHILIFGTHPYVFKSSLSMSLKVEISAVLFWCSFADYFKTITKAEIWSHFDVICHRFVFTFSIF